MFIVSLQKNWNLFLRGVKRYDEAVECLNNRIQVYLDESTNDE